MDTSYKSIVRITFPVLLSLLVEQIIGITDTAFLGHVGETELGASAIAGVCYLILFVIGSGFGVGLQVLIARLNGERKNEEVIAIFSTGFYFLILLAVVIILVAQVAIPPILHQIIKSEDVFSAALLYLNWRVFGLLFAFIIVAFRAYCIGITKTKILSVCSLVMVVVNIVCNYALVFGKFGFPALGIEGAGIGSCIAEFSAALLFVFYHRLTTKGCWLKLVNNINQQWLDLKRILNLSVWTMLQSFLSFASWLIFFVVIEHIGETALATSNIVRSISAVPFILVQAFASTGSALVSNLIGEGEQSMVLALCRRIIKVCYCFCIPLVLLGFIYPDLFIRLYTDNPVLIQQSLEPLYVMLSSFLFAVPAFVFYCVISGTGNTSMALKIGLLALAIYVLYIKVLDYLVPNVSLLWTSEHIYALAILILSGIYLVRGKWKQKQI
ncbi:MATE family efflux transporter [Bacteroides sp.]|uniref:MATE family efflux transporter n=1 Tax=Bacteroides sp. TaxID=29523 RepID=UPI0026115559|nr:MATE family efflux transporter [Bacteroides sp.]MDD3039252.1 MATE family efflux transporter [Bacteroides sp.]